MQGNELTEIRKEAGWSLHELAKMLGKQYNTVWRYEHGQLAIPQLVEIFALLMREKKNRREVEKYL